MSQDKNKNLQVLALLASTAISNALEATTVMFCALGIFGKHGEAAFFTHPSNSLAFAALNALEDQSLVELTEVLRDEHKLRPLAVEIYGIQQLQIFRDMVCHSSTVKWRSPSRQQFADDGHRWSPFRTGLVWSVLKSINGALRAQGSAEILTAIPITVDMAHMLWAVLTLSRHEHVPPDIPALLSRLEGQKDNIVAIFEQHPDGK